jgi:hypothetical protein
VGYVDRHVAFSITKSKNKAAKLQIKIRTLLTCFFWCNHHGRTKKRRGGGGKKKKTGGGIVISFMLDVFTRREREGPLAAAATENRPERHTHTHTRVFEEKRKISFFSFFQPAHIYTLSHTHTHTINDKRMEK